MQLINGKNYLAGEWANFRPMIFQGFSKQWPTDHLQRRHRDLRRADRLKEKREVLGGVGAELRKIIRPKLRLMA
jgi:hypothetical protein